MNLDRRSDLMRRGATWIAVLALLAGLALWRVREGGRDTADVVSTPATTPASRSPPRPAAPAGGASARASAAPGDTPALQRPAPAGDGFVEVRVTALGKPVAGARVRLYLRGLPDPTTQQIDWHLAGAAETAAGGVARIAARPGGYLVAARAASFAPARHDFRRLEGEAITRVALELQPALAVSGRTLKKGSLEPVPLALVTLTYDASPPGSHGRFNAPPEEQGHAASDERGRFRFEGLAPGRYLAAAQATGYARASAPFATPAAKDVAIELESASFIEGRVVSTDGKPATGAEVFAVGAEDSVAAVATELGSFSLEVPPRAWQLAARRGGESGRAESPIAVAPGATARGVEIQIGAGSSIAGTVLAALAHKPIAGAQIAVSPHRYNGDSGRATTDQTGTFAVTGLPLGSYDVLVSASGYTQASHHGITVEAGQRFPLRVELRATGALEGVVRDAAGRPVAFALVYSRSLGFSDARSEARTDDSGAYRLVGLAAGRGTFVAQRDGAALGTPQTADVPEGGTARLDFQLKEEGMVTGRVRRNDGSPPPAGAVVRVHSVDGAVPMGDQAEIPVRAAGSFIASLPAGTWQLFCGATWARQGNYVIVEPGKTAQIDLTYVEQEETPGSFSGLVLEPGGPPSARAWVWAMAGADERRTVFSMIADENGRFGIDRPREKLPDSFEVMAQNGGRSGRAAVAPGQREVAVQLQPAARLRGHLTGARVETFHLDLAVPSAPGAMFMGGPVSLDFAGDRFELRDAPATKVHVSVRTADGRYGSVDATLAPGVVQELEIALLDNASVTGRLVAAATRQPVPDVQMIADGSMPRSFPTSGADGRFRLSLGPGEHVLRVWPGEHYKSFTRTFSVQPGQALDLGDVPLERMVTSPGTIGATLYGDREGVLVRFLFPDGPAERAGVRPGDQVLAVDGRPVKGVADASPRLEGTPGTPVQITVRRNGEEHVLTIPRAS
jgi:hypothetical protein